MSVIPRPAPGQYILIYPEQHGIRVETWQGEVQINESRIGQGVNVPDEHFDAAVWRLVEAIRTVNHHGRE